MLIKNNRVLKQDKFKNKLDKTSEKRYEISIYFIDDVNIPIDINYKKAKKQIYVKLAKK